MVDLISEKEFERAVKGENKEEKSGEKVEAKVEKKVEVLKPKRAEKKAIKKLEKEIKKKRKVEKKIMKKLEKKLKKSVVKPRTISPKVKFKVKKKVAPAIVPKIDKKIEPKVKPKSKFGFGDGGVVLKKSEKNPQKKIEKKLKKVEKKISKEVVDKNKAVKVKGNFVNNAVSPVTKNVRRTTHEKEVSRTKIMFGLGVVVGAICGAVFLLLGKSIISSVSVFLLMIILFLAFNRVNKSLKKISEIKKMEIVFPDFLQLVSGELRAGITIDKAILLSARKEFEPLDAEIMRVGKDITTGRSMEESLADMSARIGSERIKKTITLITSGIRAGGNLAILLERTASNMRERSFVEKRAASNVLMYEIFIFVAVAIGAPALFGLSTILVEAMTGMMASTPAMDVGTISSLNVPFSFSGVHISMKFIIYYSMAFMVAIGALSSLIIGLVSKGDEKAGLKYLIPIIVSGLIIFGLIRYFLSDFVSKLF